jgi:hypothetical protein
MGFHLLEVSEEEEDKIKQNVKKNEEIINFTSVMILPLLLTTYTKAFQKIKLLWHEATTTRGG